MKIIEHDQGSDAWLEWRSTRWMASEAAVIMDCAPAWMEVRTWDDLRVHKAGLKEFSDKAKAMFDHGHGREERARAMLPELLGKPGAPAVVESDIYRGLGASLDWLGTDEPFWCEIKCPTPQAKWWQDVDEFDDLPAHYRWQIIHQATALDIQPLSNGEWTAYVLIYLSDDHFQLHSRTFPDAAFGDEQAALYAQWLRFGRGEEQGRGDTAWAAAAREFLVAKEDADGTAMRLAEAKAALVALGEGKGCGVEVKQSTRRGAVDTKALEALGIDPPRKQDTTFWSVRQI